MRTLGIDLAAQPRRTALCAVRWTSTGQNVVEVVQVGCTDDELVEQVGRAVKTGIDAPLGWPDPFVESVAAWHRGAAWPDHESRALRLRRTDHRVHAETGVWPLSVSSDLIANVAFRAARLQERIGRPCRAGSGTIAEVYPTAALRHLALPRRDLDAVAEACRLVIDDDARMVLTASADAHDALVCAIMARLVVLGRSTLPEPGEHDLARREGWIHLPVDRDLRAALSS